MKIVEIHNLLNTTILTNAEVEKSWIEVQSAILATDWPHGSGTFSIYPESGKKAGEGNGVKPIKIPCINMLRQYGWQIESEPPKGATVLGTGDLDAMKTTSAGYIIFEWETGNISSSHRAINKILLTMQQTDVACGYLVVPSNELKKYLTDRIGNIGELKPYFPYWDSTSNIKGCLRIIAVEHDSTSMDVPKIPKGTDGRALR